MRIYYFDDSGLRSLDPERPYFVIGGFGIDVVDIPNLSDALRKTAASYGMTLSHPVELKFNHVGRDRDNKPSKPHWMIRAGLTEMHERRALVYSSLRAAAQVPSVQFMAVAVDQRRLTPGQHPLKAGLTPLLERVQLNAQSQGTQALVMMDEEQADDRALREVMRNGSEFLKYTRIVDTIAFMPSEESPGIQVADLAAGAVSRYLNHGDGGYLRTFLRSFVHSAAGTPAGYGMKIFPRGSFAAPPARRGPWSPADQRVHTIEFQRYRGATLSWLPDGTPNRVWRRDWDSGLPQA